MTASSIQLYWSEYEAAETYQLHRVVADDVDPRDVVLGEATLLTSSAAIGFVDTAVVAGAQYYYFLIVDTPAGPTAPRWTEAHAVTDVTAPSKITGLEASVTEEGIELTWDRSADNYLFARYAIRRAEDDGESIYYGTGWAIDQTTFIDDRPPQTAATVTYEVIATDFHANTAEPTVITVALR